MISMRDVLLAVIVLLAAAITTAVLLPASAPSCPPCECGATLEAWRRTADAAVRRAEHCSAVLRGVLQLPAETQEMEWVEP